jgi:hypothetical protein
MFERQRKKSRAQWQPLQLSLLEEHKIYPTISIQPQTTHYRCQENGFSKSSREDYG